MDQEGAGVVAAVILHARGPIRDLNQDPALVQDLVDQDPSPKPEEIASAHLQTTTKSCLSLQAFLLRLTLN